MNFLKKIGFAAALSVCAASVQAAVVAEYSFDGNANDTSGNGEHLTLAGDATYGTGVFGQALSLDGAGDYASTPFNDYGLTNFTFEAWVYSNNVDNNVHYISLRKGQYIVLGDYGSSPTYNVSTWASGLSPVDAGSGNVATTLSNNTWYHLAFTFDGSTQNVYIDGVLEASLATTGSLGGGFNDRLVIGARHSTGSQYVDGMIDNVRIHDVALAQNQLGYFTDGAAAVPLPAAAWLMLGGLGAMGAMARRKRKVA